MPESVHQIFDFIRKSVAHSCVLQLCCDKAFNISVLLYSVKIVETAFEIFEVVLLYKFLTESKLVNFLSVKPTDNIFIIRRYVPYSSPDAFPLMI